MEGGQRHATHVLAGYICVIGLGKSYSMPLSMLARREAAPRPPEAGNILRREPPGPHTISRPKTRLQRAPERPLLQPSILAGWGIGGTASASKNDRLPDLQDSA